MPQEGVKVSDKPAPISHSPRAAAAPPPRRPRSSRRTERVQRRLRETRILEGMIKVPQHCKAVRQNLIPILHNRV